MTEILLHKLTIVATNLSILSLSIVLMVDHYRANYGYAKLEHVVSRLVWWLSIRGLFLLCALVSDMQWTTWAFLHVILDARRFRIFGAFSLLPMFFAQIIYANEWKSYWSVIKPIYITLCVLFVHCN